MGTPLPARDHDISLDDAAKLTRRYREVGEHAKPFPVLAFHAEAFARILRQPGCVGVRAYPAEHEDGSATLVLVGVDEKGDDMADGLLAQHPFLCPPFCSSDNLLNGRG